METVRVLPGAGEKHKQQTEDAAMTGMFSRDVQSRSMEQTVSQTEKLAGQLCSVMAAYTRKTAGLRDKGDQLVGQLLDLSRSEDPELQLGLKNLAEDLAMVQDYRQAQVDRLESRVLAPLKAYGDIVKNKRAELKKFSADRSREMKEIQKLEKIRLKNPADRQSISQAEVSVQKASNNAQRSTRLMEDAIMDFQKNKLEDIKTIFTDFVTVEMLFHAKALEIYTHTFHNLEAMELHRDLELFSSRVRLQTSSPLSWTVRDTLCTTVLFRAPAAEGGSGSSQRPRQNLYPGLAALYADRGTRRRSFRESRRRKTRKRSQTQRLRPPDARTQLIVVEDLIKKMEAVGVKTRGTTSGDCRLDSCKTSLGQSVHS
ncbi:hypothetical protein WMY93_030263 [Mugilogobius chulae]|uniref:Protein FAM92B n=1 Tax=Mugilogobius chulae TaxID=88201 RepID=A0AAW0MY51_9GOBI